MLGGVTKKERKQLLFSGNKIIFGILYNDHDLERPNPPRVIVTHKKLDLDVALHMLFW